MKTQQRRLDRDEPVILRSNHYASLGFRASNYSPDSALIVIERKRRPPTNADVQDLELSARVAGFSSLYTSALAPHEQTVFIAQGYDIVDELVVLSNAVTKPRTSSLHDVRDAAEKDLDEILSIDRDSFDPFWSFDKQTIREALRATPHAKLRVTFDSVGLTGYAITGRARRHGYLQRIAVAPRARHRSYGRTLIIDALKWLARWHTKTVVVNTQTDNIGAQNLYKSFGFTVDNYRLAILQKSIS